VIDEVVVAIHQALAFFSQGFFVVLSANRFLPLAWPPIKLKVLVFVLLLEIILGGVD
jgi:hypothetical protein